MTNLDEQEKGHGRGAGPLRDGDGVAAATAANILAVQVGVLDNHRLASSLAPPELQPYISTSEWIDLTQDLERALTSCSSSILEGPPHHHQAAARHRNNAWMLERVLPVVTLVGLILLVVYIGWHGRQKQQSHGTHTTLDSVLWVVFLVYIIVLRVSLQHLTAKVAEYRHAREKLATPVLEEHTRRLQSKPGKPVFLWRQYALTVPGDGPHGGSRMVRTDAAIEVLVVQKEEGGRQPSEMYQLHES